MLELQVEEIEHVLQMFEKLDLDQSGKLDTGTLMFEKLDLDQSGKLDAGTLTRRFDASPCRGVLPVEGRAHAQCFQSATTHQCGEEVLLSYGIL